MIDCEMQKDSKIMETIADEFHKWLIEKTNLTKNSANQYKVYIKKLCENVNEVFGDGWFESLRTDPEDVSVYKRKQCSAFIEFCIRNVSETHKMNWNNWRSAFRKFEDFQKWRKIGQIAQHVLAPMLCDGCATPEEIRAMQTLEYSHKQFGLQFPLLVKEGTDYQRVRYYVDPLLINGERYYMCSQWYETPANNDRPLLLQWIATHQK